MIKNDKLFSKARPTLAAVCLPYRVHALRLPGYSAYSSITLKRPSYVLGSNPTVVIDYCVGAPGGLGV